MPKQTNLADKKKLFVENYLRDFNATRAYRETISNKSQDHVITRTASKLLLQDDVQQYLKEKLEERKKNLHIDQTYVVRKLIDITEADFVDAITFVSAEELENIPKEIRKLIQSVEIVKNRVYNGQTSFENENEKYKVTFMSKDKALELLGKHTGAFMKDNVQGQYDMGKMSFTDALAELDL